MNKEILKTVNYFKWSPSPAKQDGQFQNGTGSFKMGSGPIQ